MKASACAEAFLYCNKDNFYPLQSLRFGTAAKIGFLTVFDMPDALNC